MKKNSKKIWYILGGTVAGLVILILVAKQAGWIGKEKPTEVELAEVTTSNLTEVVAASGKIQPELEVKISPDVPGEIIGLYVQEGDSVKKGQLLVKIQPENYASIVDRFRAGVDQAKASAEQSKAAIARAESQFLRAQLEFNRQQKLFSDKVISRSEYEVAEANFKIAKQDLDASKASYEAARYGIASANAALKDAQENLRKTNIYAPINGIVSKLSVELGERVVGTSQMAGTEIMRIANLNNMEVKVNVSENDIVRIAMGDTADIEVDAYTYTNKKFKGIVTEIANTANNATGATNAASTSTDAVTEFEVNIRILPSSYRDIVDVKGGKRYPFKPGMTATVDIVTEMRKNALTVPIAAVTTRKDEKKEEEVDTKKEVSDVEKIEKPVKAQEIIFVYKDGKAVARQIKTGITDTSAGTIEVLSGLSKGEQIITGPYLEVSKNLKDGDLVTKKVAEVKKENKK
ncbi:MAG: efflux RND transporter periplasmic adaptor subunit [Spirosomataceae bacterium]